MVEIKLAIQKAMLDGLVKSKLITRKEAEYAFGILLESTTFVKKSGDKQ